MGGRQKRAVKEPRWRSDEASLAAPGLRERALSGATISPDYMSPGHPFIMGQITVKEATFALLIGPLSCLS